MIYDELKILLAIERLGANAYGVTINGAVGLPYSRMYITLAYLKKSGFISSKVGDPTLQRGFRPKRFFALTEKGRMALHGGDAAV